MEIAGGSLGHGLTVATGMALGLRYQGNNARVYNLLSDGELNEGSTWQAAQVCAHYGLDNLTAIVDVNGPKWAWYHSPPRTRCSQPDVRTTFSAWTSPSRH